MTGPSARLQLAGHQPMANSVFTILKLAPPSAYVTTDREGKPPEVWASPGMFNPARPTELIAPQDGIYRAWALPKFADKDAGGRARRTGRRAIGVQMNDGNTDILTSVPADPGGTTSLYGEIPLALLAGETVSFWAEQQSGYTLDMVGHSAKDTAVGLTWDRPLP